MPGMLRKSGSTTPGVGVGVARTGAGAGAGATTPTGVGASFLPSCQCSIMSVSLSNNSLPTWEAEGVAPVPHGWWLKCRCSLPPCSPPSPLVERLRQCVPQLHSRLSLALSFCTSRLSHVWSPGVRVSGSGVLLDRNSQIEKKFPF